METNLPKENNIPTATSNPEKDLYLLPVSKDIAKRFFSELFISTSGNLMTWLKKSCFVLHGIHDANFLKSPSKTNDLYAMHMIIMAKFALENPYKARTSGFIDFYSKQPESKDYPLEKPSFYYINYIFCTLLNINNAVEQDVVFEDLVYSAFPRGRSVLWHKQKNMTLSSVNRSIDLSMNKMKNFLLDFEVATNFNDHLVLNGHKVWIYSYDLDHQDVLYSYEYNRLAQLYGIEMVGMEILKTYTFLMSDKESKDIMFEYDVWRGAGGLENPIFIMSQARTRDIGYTVLADRFFGLEKKVNSFWFRFQREAGHRRLYKPVDFYFIIFSIFLGLLTVVQTISGLASLILQAKSS